MNDRWFIRFQIRVAHFSFFPSQGHTFIETASHWLFIDQKLGALLNGPFAFCSPLLDIFVSFRFANLIISLYAHYERKCQRFDVFITRWPINGDMNQSYGISHKSTLSHLNIGRPIGMVHSDKLIVMIVFYREYWPPPPFNIFIHSMYWESIN